MSSKTIAKLLQERSISFWLQNPLQSDPPVVVGQDCLLNLDLFTP
jgi:hypothetical protein